MSEFSPEAIAKRYVEAGDDLPPDLTEDLLVRLREVREGVRRALAGMVEHATDTVWAGEFTTMADALADALGCDLMTPDGNVVEALDDE